MIVSDIFGRRYNDCQKHRQEDRNLHPSKCWECLVIRGKHMDKGSVKGGDLSAVLKWAKEWGETTVFDEIYALLWDFVVGFCLGPYRATDEIFLSTSWLSFLTFSTGLNHASCLSLIHDEHFVQLLLWRFSESCPQTFSSFQHLCSLWTSGLNAFCPTVPLHSMRQHL